VSLYRDAYLHSDPYFELWSQSMTPMGSETGWSNETILVPKVAEIAQYGSPKVCARSVSTFTCNERNSQNYEFCVPFFAFGLARKRAVRLANDLG
jgi:hypothetical protein